MDANSPAKNLVLIGMRCTGKTSVGKLAAEKLGLRFVDTDEIIVQRAGKTIREIFAQDGEPAFRTLEAEVVQEVAAHGGQAIATGGGVVLNPQNVKALREDSLVIHLVASPETIHARLVADAARAEQRPALTREKGMLKEVRQVWRDRMADYREAGHFPLSVERSTVEELAEFVTQLFQDFCRGGPEWIEKIAGEPFPT